MGYPTYPVKVNTDSSIIDVPKFIESHLATVKANNGNRIFLPHLERLLKFKEEMIKHLST